MLCAGGAVVDLKIRLAVASVAGTSNPGSGTTSFGGVARNVAENLAALGVEVGLLSAVGDDPPGAALLFDLDRCGVDRRQVAVLAGESTAQYVALLEPDGELTIGAAAMAVLDRIGADRLAAAWPAADGGNWVFCDGNLGPDVLAAAIALARRTGVALAVDAVSTHKVIRLPADLRGLSLLSCNRDEALAWLAGHQHPVGLGAADDMALASALHAAGAAAVLLTRGAEGLVVVGDGVCAQVPAVPARVVDVTGAGDALVAGTVAALVGGADLLTAAGSGAERAARTVESPLSVLGVPPGPG